MNHSTRGTRLPRSTAPTPTKISFRMRWPMVAGRVGQTAALPAGAGTVRDVVLDPDDWRSAYVIDSNQVFRTTDAGASWTDITGNLVELGAGDFRTNAFVGSTKALLVGTN